MREIVLDTETTGLDPHSGHRVVEIGCVELWNHLPTGNHFHVYLNPQRDMPQEAFRVHGLSDEFLSDKPLFSTIADAFLEFLQTDPLVIHNASFDMKFINAELERIGYPEIPMKRTIDTVLMARKKFPGQPASLDALCKRFAIDLSARTKHGALLDSELLADVYMELLGGRQVKLHLDSQVQEPERTAQKNSNMLKYKEFFPTDDELHHHAAMLSKLSGAMWLK